MSKVTYEIDSVTWNFPACSVNRLFGCVTEQKIPTKVFYFRSCYPSGKKYEDREIYLSENAVKLAIASEQA